MERRSLRPAHLGWEDLVLSTSLCPVGSCSLSLCHQLNPHTWASLVMLEEAGAEELGQSR